MTDATALDKLGQELDPAERSALLARMQPQTWQAGQVVVRQGDRVGGLWLVADGELEVYLQPDDPLVISRVGPGEWLGEVALLDPGPATASVRAATPARLLYMDPAALASLQAEEPRVARQVIRTLGRTLARRLRATSQQVLTWQGDAPALERPAQARGWLSRMFRGLFGEEAP